MDKPTTQKDPMIDAEYLNELAAAQQKARAMEIVYDTILEIRAIMEQPNPEPINGQDRTWTPEQLAAATGARQYWIDRALEEAVKHGELVRWVGPGGIGNTFTRK